MSVVEKTLEKLRGASEHASAGTAADGFERVPAQVPGRVLPVDFDALRCARLTPSEEDERRLMAQYRHIKRPLVANATGRGAPIVRNGHLILIASAMPGEGQTFTALNLALSMSFEKDLHIVLVDADFPKPQLTPAMGATEAPGLLDVLRDQKLDPERAVLATDVPNLSLIPAGEHSPHATELLASSRMGQLAALLLRRDRQRVLLFDSPPLLLTNESQILTRMAGQVLMVVRADSTPQPVVLDALELLQEDAVVYLVLNGSVRSPTDAYYYYGYGDAVRESAACV